MSETILPWITAVLHKDGSTSIFHFWAQEWITGGKNSHDVITFKLKRMTVREALEFLDTTKPIFFKP